MFQNYFKIAFRNLVKYKSYSFINIFGLAMGIACCVLILLFVQDERSYDQFHDNADTIYRTVLDRKLADGPWRTTANGQYFLGPMMQEEFPQIKKLVRLSQRSHLVRYADRQFEEDRFLLADSTMFEVFTFPFVQGDPATALDAPYSVVLTESTARKYFGEANPIGQILIADQQLEFTVTGVIEDVPAQSHMQFDFVGSLSSTKGRFSDEMFSSWGAFWIFSYFLFDSPRDAQTVQALLPAFLDRKLPPNIPIEAKLTLQPLTDIHLHSQTDAELEANGNITYLYLFGAIAALILLIACVNFMNLSTARSAARAKEVGVRKSVGASRNRLVQQFLGESMLLSGLAFLVALLLVEAALPILNSLTEKSLAFSYLENVGLLAVLVGITLFVGLLAGSYPAFYLSSFRAAEVLKGRLGGPSLRLAANLRKGLVVFQFCISTFLIIGALAIFQQLQFVQDKNLGFDQEQVLNVRLNNPEARRDSERLLNTLLQNPQVVSASLASNAPPSGLNSWWVRPMGTPEDDRKLVSIIAADYNYVETLGLELVEGRNFSKDFAGDAESALLMNEAAVKFFGLTNAVGQQFQFSNGNGKVGQLVGVVKDYHLTSLHSEITPVILHLWPDWYGNVLLKLRPENTASTLAALAQTWKAQYPTWPFEYTFLDDRFEALYRAEQRLGEIFGYFAGLAIFIASLGLFGLAAFTAERRTKEVGVRKVMGASVTGLLVLLSKDFLKLVGIAFFLAVPLAYFAMNRWLEDFAYRIELGAGLFVAAGLLALLIALITVSYQALKVATADPVKALRYE